MPNAYCPRDMTDNLASPSLSGQRLIPLIPDGHTVAGADFLHIFADARRPSDDSAGHAATTVAVNFGSVGSALAQIVPAAGDNHAATDDVPHLEDGVHQTEFGSSILISPD